MNVLRIKPVDTIIAHAEKKRLRKQLGALDLVLLGIGCTIGTGIFVLTGVGAGLAGPGLTIAFIVAGLACGFAAMAYAELASMVPVAGSAYTYSYAVLEPDPGICHFRQCRRLRLVRLHGRYPEPGRPEYSRGLDDRHPQRWDHGSAGRTDLPAGYRITGDRDA